MTCGQCGYVRAFYNDPERFCSSACASKAEREYMNNYDRQVTNVQKFRLISLLGQLKLEEKGMRSSGGALRPRIAKEFNLSPRASYQAYREAITAKLPKEVL